VLQCGNGRLESSTPLEFRFRAVPRNRIG